MKILAVIDSLGLGGAETQLAEATSYLTTERGHELLVCSLLPPQPHEARLSEAVERVYLNKRSRLALPRVIVGVARLIRQFRPNVAYSRLPYANGVTRLATWLPGCRTRHVAGVDSVPEAFALTYIWTHPGVPLYRWLERQADRIVCNSEATGRAVIAEGYPGGRISVVPNGIDVDRFRPPTVRQLQDVPRLICVAALRPEKGVDRLVQLLAPLLRSKRATLTLVGDGSERTAVEAVISTLQLGNSVRLLGPQTDIVPILHDADIYVSAARIEGFGIAVAEAAATALPAVCVAAPGGLNEVVVDGVTGYLVPEHRGDLFQESVRRLCDDAALRLKLGSAAQAHVRRRFSLAEVGRQLESVLLAR